MTLSGSRVVAAAKNSNGMAVTMPVPASSRVFPTLTCPKAKSPRAAITARVTTAGSSSVPVSSAIESSAPADARFFRNPYSANDVASVSAIHGGRP